MGKAYPQNGSVFRVHKTHDYTVMSNHHLKNKLLPLKAKGLLSVMLALPPEWNFSINGLAALSLDGRDSILSIIKILQDTGYMFLEKVRNERGQFDTIYNIYEEPQEIKESTESDFPTREEISTGSDFPIRYDRVGSAESENPEQLNIKEINTKESSIKKNKKIKNPYGQFSNVHLTDEHIEKLLKIYKTEELKNKAIEILSSYKAAKGKTYKNDYAVLNEFNWVYAKVFSKKSNERSSAGENEKTDSPVPDYEKNSRW